MSCNHLTNKFIPIVFFLQSVHASLSCKCTDGPLSQHCKVLSYFKRFSLATTWMGATQQFSQTPNSFSSFKKKLLYSETSQWLIHFNLLLKKLTSVRFISALVCFTRDVAWHELFRKLRESLCKSGPLRFASENRFLLNFAHEYILVQK